MSQVCATKVASGRTSAAVVLAHGLTGSRHELDSIARKLHERDVTTIALDMESVSSNAGRSRRPVIDSLNRLHAAVNDPTHALYGMIDPGFLDSGKLFSFGHSTDAAALAASTPRTNPRGATWLPRPPKPMRASMRTSR